MAIAVVPISLFDQVRERMVSLKTAYRVLDTATAAHTTAVRAEQHHPCEQTAHALCTTEYAVDEAQALVINTAHTCSFNISLLLTATGGHYPALNQRLVDVVNALKDETLAFELYNHTRPGDESTDILAALNRWKTARVNVVQAARKLTAIGINPVDTELDDGSDDGESRDHGA